MHETLQKQLQLRFFPARLLCSIHELYFPFVLMNPLTLVAMIAGGCAAALVFVTLNAGLVATYSPGSIFTAIALAPKGALLPVLCGIATGAAAGPP